MAVTLLLNGSFIVLWVSYSFVKRIVHSPVAKLLLYNTELMTCVVKLIVHSPVGKFV